MTARPPDVEASAPVAVGRLEVGRWIGLAAGAEAGYQLVAGDDETVLAGARASGTDILALAHAYFSEALEPPPASLEATHADIAAAVRWVATRPVPHHAPDPEASRLVAEALDAIDDGLALDEVLTRLARAMPSAVAEDVRTYLAERVAGLVRIG